MLGLLRYDYAGLWGLRTSISTTVWEICRFDVKENMHTVKSEDALHDGPCFTYDVEPCMPLMVKHKVFRRMRVPVANLP